METIEENGRYEVDVIPRRKILRIVDRAVVLGLMNGCDLMNGRQFVDQEDWTKGRETKMRARVAVMNAEDFARFGPCDDGHAEVKRWARGTY